MQVLIVGATGQLGRHITERALASGHSVTAFARNPKNISLDDPRLRRFAGDACVEHDVLDAVPGHDVVVVALGTGKSRKNTVRSQGTRNVIAAMRHHGVRRLVCQTTLGCQETWDQLNFYWKRIMFGAVIRPIFLDHEAQERLTQASGLDWTIVRPSAFRDSPTGGKLLIDFPPSQRNLAFTVAKGEVASFIVSQLDDTTYLHKAVSISR